MLEEGVIAGYAAQAKRHFRPAGLRRRAWSGWALLLVCGLCAIGGAVRAAEKQADLFGVIEIGGSGVKASVLQMTASQAKEIEARFLASGDELKYEQLSPEKLRPYPEIETSVIYKENVPATVRVVEDFISKMYDDHAVQKENAFVVVSSGVRSTPHFGELMKGLKSSDKILPVNVGYVSSEEECSLTYRWIVPQYRYDEAALIDIGSSITIGCYVENAGTAQQRFRGFVLSQFGTKGFAKHVNEELARRKIEYTHGDFAKLALELRRSEIHPELEAKRATNPGLENLPRLYLAGGIVWATATLVRPEESGSRWVELSANDFQTMHNRAADGRGYALDLGRLKTQNARDELTKEVRRIERIFNADQMIAGAEILLALKHRLKLERKARMFFAGVARDGWRSQYLLEKILNQDRKAVP